MRVRLATTLLLLANFAPAVATDEAPDAIRRKAFLAGSDRAAAGIVLHFFDRDAAIPWQTDRKQR
jgi:hypothetical protein